MPTPTTIIVESGSGQVAQITTAFSAPIQCRLFDEFGNWMPSASVTFDAGGVFNPNPGGIFTGANPYITTTGSDGRAVSAALSANDAVGAWVGTVSSTAVPSVSTTFSMTNTLTPVVPTLTTLQFVSGGTQTVPRNTAYAVVAVRCLDQYGATFPGGSVTMTCPAGRGTFPGGLNTNTATADGSGVATFAVYTASSTLGAFGPTIAGTGTNTLTASFNTIDPTVVTSLSAYSGNNQSAATGFPYAEPMVIRAANAANGVVAGAVITVTAPGSAPTLVWDSPATNPVTIASDVNGMATTPAFSADATAGSFFVFASCPGTSGVFFRLTNGGSPPADSSPALVLCEV